ncbi:MAG: efflux RND transporter permease subunit [Planctomycetes bacterium]|nr:efflux RND transporter permease subunit [Planctomycetota bacterium]
MLRHGLLVDKEKQEITDLRQDDKASSIGRFTIHHAISITFVSIALCIGGIYASLHISSSVFPQTDFPRVAILIDNGVMPGDEMMARITRPIEEAMKDIPGAEHIRSATGRGSAEISVYFNWKVDMVRSELYVLGRLSQIRSTLPPTAEASVYRITFSSFPILGVSLTSPTRDITHLWEKARYDLKPQFLSIPGVARVDLVGGRQTEYHIIVDPMLLKSAGMTMQNVVDALEKNNRLAPAGMHEENHSLYLTVLDGRLSTPEAVENFVVDMVDDHPIRIADFAVVERGPEPVYNIVTADGRPAVLLNICSQPDGSTLDIAKNLKEQIRLLNHQLPPDMKLAFYYDQSLIVHESVKSVWGALIFGLFLSIIVLLLFLKDFGATFVAVLAIPISVLFTLLAMKVAGLSYNIMTMGGVAAAIGLIIDDAIVVVESIYYHLKQGVSRVLAVQLSVGEIFRPLVASTLTPVVVFIPLAFLGGLTGVFFRALAMTMVVSLLSSLVLAVTLTPSIGVWLMRAKPSGKANQSEIGGPVLLFIVAIYEKVVRKALDHCWLSLAFGAVIIWAGFLGYRHLSTEFLPPMDEGGFVIDYVGPPGTSLEETNNELQKAEAILVATPDVESYSRRTGARLALAIAEPHTGDFLVKLRQDRQRTTDEVISELRRKFNAAVPRLQWEFPGILGDLIGDLQWAPNPIEIRLFSSDIEYLKQKAPKIEEMIRQVPGIVDTFDGLTYTGNTISFQINNIQARRFGLSTTDVANALHGAMIGTEATSILEGDRIIGLRVMADRNKIRTISDLENLPVSTAAGRIIKLSQVATLSEQPGRIELRRDDMRQNISVAARLEGRDMGSAMKEILQKLKADKTVLPAAYEIAGLYKQQLKAFKNLLAVLIVAVFLVFTVLLIEFRSFSEPIAIVYGSILALFGTISAMLITGTSLNIVSFLGAIIGIGIVAKNGILMLDRVDHLIGEGLELKEALVQSGRRRLRPVLMTSLTTLLGLLPLAYGIGSGADMLRPLAIAIMGALCISVLLSLIATPTLYYMLVRLKHSMIAKKYSDLG